MVSRLPWSRRSAARRAFPFDVHPRPPRDGTAMTKRTRLLPVRPKPNRLVLELLEDRSLPSGMAGGDCDSPPPTTDGSGTTAWDSPRGWHEPSTDARPASFSSDRDYGGMTPTDRAPHWGGWQD